MLLQQKVVHAGAIISLIILVILLIVNWNKCVANPLSNWLYQNSDSKPVPILQTKRINTTAESFTSIIQAQNKGIDARDIDVNINPTSREITVKFTGVDNPDEYKVKSYLLVLAKYDKDLNKIGTLDVKLSEELGSRTLAEEVAGYCKKYQNTLTSDRINKINLLGSMTDASAQTILNYFLNAAVSTNKTLSDLGAQPTQEINMFFELIDIIYKYQLDNNAKSLKIIYSELRDIYAQLPADLEGTSVPSNNDRNYDYLAINTDNKKAAADLKMAMENYMGTTTNPGLKMAFITGNNKPSQIILDALNAFMVELIRIVNMGSAKVTGNICDSVTKKCGYTFTQIEPADTQGNIYYYKLGIGVIFVNIANGSEQVSKIKAYSFGSGNKLQYFRVDTNLVDQEKLLKRLAELERSNMQKALQQPASLDNTAPTDANGKPVSSQMDAYLNMLKPYLGNYPDEYLLGTEVGKELTLDKYLNQSLASGQFNITADLTGLTPKTTDMAASII